MRFRFKDSRGKVVQLDDVTWLAGAVRDGRVTPDTLLAVGDEKEFRRAEHVVAYQQVVVGLERNRLGAAPPLPERSDPPAPASSASRRPVLWAGLGLAVAALVVFLLRKPNTPPSAVSAVPAPSGEMQASLDRLVIEFGDSIALRQRRLETWVAEQRFEQRLSGRSLASAASLRAVRAAVGAYLAQVDTLMAGVSVLSARLVLRADSLEGTDGVRAGLFAAAGDALRGWETDLSAYAGIQRSRAAALDSLAQFTLERQQSFVVREGQAVFLSRDDAARFRRLRGELDGLAGSERRWAEESLRKYPHWMSSLAPADRPAFHRDTAQRSNQ